MRLRPHLCRLQEKGDPPVDGPLWPILARSTPESLDALVADLFRSERVVETRMARQAHGSLAEVLAQPLPSWADPSKIEQAHDFFAVHGLTAYLILATASLPACYVDESISEVLAISGRLISQVDKRLGETSRMVLDVMEPSGLASTEPLSPGLETALRVRLLHSTMRYLIRLDPRAREGEPLSDRLWQHAAVNWQRPWLPINQLDLITTMLTFSYVIIKGWRETGVPCTDESEHAYLHTWNVIGHVLGIELAKDELPETYEEAEELFEASLQIVPRQKAADSVELTRRVFGYVDRLTGSLARPLLPFLTHRLLGSERANRLAVRPPTGLRALHAGLLLWLVRVFSAKLAWLYTRLPVLSMVFGLSRIARRILEGYSEAGVLTISSAVRQRRRLRR